MRAMATAQAIDRTHGRQARRVNAFLLALLLAALVLSLKHGVVKLSWLDLRDAGLGQAGTDVMMLLT